MAAGALGHALALQTLLSLSVGQGLTNCRSLRCKRKLRVGFRTDPMDLHHGLTDAVGRPDQENGVEAVIAWLERNAPG